MMAWSQLSAAEAQSVWVVVFAILVPLIVLAAASPLLARRRRADEIRRRARTAGDTRRGARHAPSRCRASGSSSCCRRRTTRRRTGSGSARSPPSRWRLASTGPKRSAGCSCCRSARRFSRASPGRSRRTASAWLIGAIALILARRRGRPVPPSPPAGALGRGDRLHRGVLLRLRDVPRRRLGGGGRQQALLGTRRPRARRGDARAPLVLRPRHRAASSTATASMPCSAAPRARSCRCSSSSSSTRSYFPLGAALMILGLSYIHHRAPLRGLQVRDRDLSRRLCDPRPRGSGGNLMVDPGGAMAFMLSTSVEDSPFILLILPGLLFFAAATLFHRSKAETLAGVLDVAGLAVVAWGLLHVLVPEFGEEFMMGAYVLAAKILNPELVLAALAHRGRPLPRPSGALHRGHGVRGSRRAWPRSRAACCRSTPSGRGSSCRAGASSTSRSSPSARRR